MRPRSTLVPLGSSYVAAQLVPGLNITALSSRNEYSVLECWQLLSIPAYHMAAVNYAVANTTVATWSRIEPHTTVGEAWAPHVQLSVILSGLIRITAPWTGGHVPHVPVCSHDGLAQGGDRPEPRVTYVLPGTTRSSVLIAADVREVSTIAGHFTEFPSDEPTVLVQVPFLDDRAPEHTILHEGPCS